MVLAVYYTPEINDYRLLLLRSFQKHLSPGLVKKILPVIRMNKIVCQKIKTLAKGNVIIPLGDKTSNMLTEPEDSRGVIILIFS